MDIKDLAYAAGIIDGEGCIYIDRFVDKRRPNTRNYVLRVKVAMTDFEVPYWFEEMFGGFVSVYKRKDVNCRPAAIWGITNKRAIDFLNLIKPFIKIKQRQIEIAEEFEKTILRDKSKNRQTLLREVLFAAMQNMNQRR